MQLRPLPHRLKAGTVRVNPDLEIPQIPPPVAEELGSVQNEGPKIQYFPYEVIAEILQYLTMVERQQIRATCQSFNRVVSQLFETSFHLVQASASDISKTECRFLQVTVRQKLERHFVNIMLSTPFYTRIGKLELRDSWNKRISFRILKYTVGVKELTLVCKKTVDWQESDRAWVQSLEKTGEVATWLPALTNLRIQPFRSANQVLRLIAQIVARGNLTNLVVDWNNLIGIYPDPKHLILDVIEDGVVCSKEIPDNLSIYGLVGKILNWNRNSLNQVRFQSTQVVSRYRLAELNEIAECHCDKGQAQLNSRLRSFSGLLLPTDALAGETKNDEIGWDEWNKTRNEHRWRNTLLTQDRLQELKLTFALGVFEREFRQAAAAAPELEILTRQIIFRHSLTLKSISLEFQPKDTYVTFANTDFGTLFSTCNSLQRLEIHILSMYAYRHSAEQIFPEFRGIENLPESLTHFCTSLPIVSAEMDLQALKLENLRNLRSLTFGSRAWFTFNGVPLTTLDIDHLRQLKEKLPKLNTIKLDITSTYRSTDGGPDEMKENPWVTPALLERYRATLTSTGRGERIQSLLTVPASEL